MDPRMMPMPPEPTEPWELTEEPAAQEMAELPAEQQPRSENLAEMLSREERDGIGKRIVGGYERDRESRRPWAERRANIRKLFACLKKKRSHPWPGAANVNMSGILVAIEQWVAREFQALTSDPSGPLYVEDPGQPDSHRAKRVRTSVNTRIHAERRYYDGLDRLVALIGLDGTALRKIWFDPVKKKKCRQTVPASDVVVSYDYSDDIRDCRRITHVLRMMPDEIEEAAALGVFFDTHGDDGKPMPGGKGYDENGDAIERVVNEVQGVQLETAGFSDAASAPNPDIVDSDTPRLVLECHCVMRMPQDVTPMPYIVTVDYETKRVFRIVSRIYQDIDGSMRTGHHWVKYSFFPNPDGFYDFGLGQLLESHNEVANTAANQLLDAGTLSNLPSGLISDRLGLKKGALLFEPGELKPVEGYVDDVGKGVHIFQWPGPNPTVIQLLQMFMQQMQEISGISSVLMGMDQPTNQPATTTISLIEQGLKPTLAVHQRILSSYSEELALEYELDRRYLDDATHNEIIGGDDSPEFQQWLQLNDAYQMAQQQWMMAMRSGVMMPPPQPPPEFPFSVAEDFSPGLKIRPTADPKVSSLTQEIMIAEKSYQAVMSNPLTQGDPMIVREALRRFLVSFGAQDVEQLLPQEPGPPPDIDQYVENSMFMAGDFSAQVLPQQDHEQHLLIITQLEADPLYQEAMWPDRKKALEAHKLAHMAQLYLARNKPNAQAMAAQVPAAPGASALGADAGMVPVAGDEGVPAAPGLGEAMDNAPPSLLGRIDSMHEAAGSDLLPE
jgi:hypothetical protein